MTETPLTSARLPVGDAVGHPVVHDRNVQHRGLGVCVVHFLGPRAGGDADHFVQTPHGRPPLIALLSGGERASVLELPVADA
jgi:hypothetical protein